jgi:hypothetical protein
VIRVGFEGAIYMHLPRKAEIPRGGAMSYMNCARPAEMADLAGIFGSSEYLEEVLFEE